MVNSFKRLSTSTWATWTFWRGPEISSVRLWTKLLFCLQLMWKLVQNYYFTKLNLRKTYNLSLNSKNKKRTAFFRGRFRRWTPYGKRSWLPFREWANDLFRKRQPRRRRRPRHRWWRSSRKFPGARWRRWRDAGPAGTPARQRRRQPLAQLVAIDKICLKIHQNLIILVQNFKNG